jgi:hypothetical protein
MSINNTNIDKSSIILIDQTENLNIKAINVNKTNILKNIFRNFIK